MIPLFQTIEGFLEDAARQKKQPLIVVCGPTASGKTALSLALAQHFNGEIISADSAQVYRQMDLGTDKVSMEERTQVPHHLIDVRNPDESFTMADFKREGTLAIEDIDSRGKLPILCGGTGLYLSALIENYDLPEAPPNPELRAALEAEAEQVGPEAMHQRLAALDPDAASKVHANNVRYVIRALEIVQQTKQTLSPQKAESPYAVFKVGIQWPREVLYARINARVDQQIEKGILTELKGLLDKGYAPTLQSMSALGYKEYIPYIKGEKPLEECKEELKQGTRNFAKRQLTWFRKWQDLHWLTPEEFNQITG